MATDRFDIDTADGGKLAVWVEGDGPAIVLVHGSMCDHTTFDPLIAELRRDFTTFAMDRRGFGASPESGAYSAQREFGDVAAVADAVAHTKDGQVALFGHSWGASCAMGGAALTRAVAHLILYEPSLGLALPPGAIERIERTVAAGDHEAAILSVLIDIVGMTQEEADQMRASPKWPERVATAPTIAREARIESSWVLGPGQFDGIKAATLFLAGSDSPPELAEVTRRSAAAIPGAGIHLLRGHGHFAYKSDPRAVADLMRDFTRGCAERG
jgi:pimeloyl-ACP methyl ester carboxylesterase